MRVWTFGKGMNKAIFVIAAIVIAFGVMATGQAFAIGQPEAAHPHPPGANGVGAGTCDHKGCGVFFGSTAHH